MKKISHKKYFNSIRMRLIIKKYKIMQIQKLKLRLNKEIIKILENRILKVNQV